MLEYVCEEHGGCVKVAKAYYDGFSKSVAKNFAGTGIIASMQQCNDFFLGTRLVAMGRAGDDSWFEDPASTPWACSSGLLAAGRTLEHGELSLQQPMDGAVPPPGLGHVPVRPRLRRLPHGVQGHLRRPRLRE
jgi:stachyose synthetase